WIGGDARALISVAECDRTNEIFHVKSIGSELLSQGVQQFRVARRVLLAQVIDGFDNADAEKVCPESVGGGTSEVGILRVGHPVSERSSRGPAGSLGLLAVEESRFDDFIAARELDLHQIPWPAAGHIGEEGSIFPKLFADPIRLRMVVTLGAFQLDAKKQPR